MLKTVQITAGLTNGTVTNIATGTGLTGGPITTTGTISIANTTVTAGTYGDATNVAQVTINAQGQITNATNVAIAIANSAVSGLGTMSTQNANAVTITGGTIDNTTVGATTPTTVKTTVLTVTTSSTLGNATANQINNTPIGNNTPSTGVFTNLSSANVTITGGTINVANTSFSTSTSNSASFLTPSLPLVPLGYLLFNLNGTNVKIPYYSV